MAVFAIVTAEIFGRVPAMMLAAPVTWLQRWSCSGPLRPRPDGSPPRSVLRLQAGTAGGTHTALPINGHPARVDVGGSGLASLVARCRNAPRSSSRDPRGALDRVCLAQHPPSHSAGRALVGPWGLVDDAAGYGDPGLTAVAAGKIARAGTVWPPGTWAIDTSLMGCLFSACSVEPVGDCAAVTGSSVPAACGSSGPRRRGTALKFRWDRPRAGPTETGSPQRALLWHWHEWQVQLPWHVQWLPHWPLWHWLQQHESAAWMAA